MTDLRYAIRITGDASGLRQATTQGEADLNRLGETAVRTTEKVTAATAGAGAAPAVGPSPAAAPRSPPAAPAVAPLPPAAPASNVVPFPTAAAATGGALRPDQLKNLGYQVNDIVTSLGSGASVMQVLAQQGGQVYQVLQDAKGGVAGGLRDVASRLVGLASPVRIAVGGFAALAAGAAYLGYSWHKSQEEIETGLAGIGRLSRASAGDVNRIGDEAAGSGRMSAASGRGIASAVASTGRVDVGDIGKVVGLAPGYAKLFGKDLADSGADLARIFSDPVKGAAELDARLGSLDAATQRYIRSLVEQGNRQEAVRVMIRAFGPELEAAAEKTSLWAKAWNAVSGAADAVGRSVSNAVVGAPLDQRLADARQRVTTARQALAQGGNPSSVDPDHAEALRQQGYSDAQMRAELNPSAPGSAPGAGERAQREVADAEASLEHLEEVSRRASQATFQAIRTAELADWSKTAREAIDGLSPEIATVEKLANQIKLLGDAAGREEALKALGLTADQVRLAMSRATGAVESFLSAEDKVRASEALTTRSILARTDAEKGAIAAERERLALSGRRDISDESRQRSIAAASDAVFTQGVRDSEDRLRSAQAARAAAGLPSYQRQIAEMQTRWRPIDERGGNAQTLANNAATKTAEMGALQAETIGRPILEANQRIREQASALDVQKASFQASAEAAATMAAKQELVNGFLRQGIEPTGQLAKTIDDLAAKMGKVSAASDEMQRVRSNITGGLDELRSGSRGLATGVFSDLRQGKNPAQTASNALGSMADRLFDRTVSKPATEYLLGQDGKGGGGLLGDGLSKMFGSVSSVTTPTMNVTAATVAISGAGLGGLTTGAATGGANPAVLPAALTGGAKDIRVPTASASAAVDPYDTGLTRNDPGFDPKDLPSRALRLTVPSAPQYAPEVPSGAPFWGSGLNLTPSGKLGGSLADPTGATSAIKEGGDAAGDALKDVATDVKESGSVVGSAIKGLGSLFNSSNVPGGGGLANWLGLGGSSASAAAPAAATGFAVGGYTGHGGRLEPAGVVHKGEYVFDAFSTRAFGVDYLEGMRQGARRGFAVGGFAGDVAPPSMAMAGSAPSGGTAGPMINAPISISMEGSSGNPGRDQAHAVEVGRRVEDAMDRSFARNLSRAMSQGGDLHAVGVRRSS